MWARTVVLFLAFMAVQPALSPAMRYTMDEEESRVTFNLRHLGILTVTGNFSDFSGTFHFDPAHIENSSVQLIIYSGSVKTGNQLRNRHLKSSEFFWADRYPEIRFQSERIENIEGNRFEIHGHLTIRNITKPVVFETEWREAPAGSAEAGHIHFETHTFISRNDFELGTSKGWLTPIMMITNETLEIRLDVTGVPETAP